MSEFDTVKNIIENMDEEDEELIDTDTTSAAEAMIKRKMDEFGTNV